jgi:hypothetical protein
LNQKNLFVIFVRFNFNFTQNPTFLDGHLACGEAGHSFQGVVPELVGRPFRFRLSIKHTAA